MDDTNAARLPVHGKAGICVQGPLINIIYGPFQKVNRRFSKNHIFRLRLVSSVMAMI